MKAGRLCLCGITGGGKDGTVMNALYEYIVEKKHHALRRTLDWEPAEEFCAQGLSPEERMTRRFERMCREEAPVLLPGERICFMRTVASLPEIFTPGEKQAFSQTHFIHEAGYLSNLCPDYAAVIGSGLLAAAEKADEYGRRCIAALIGLADRYREKALEAGDAALAQVLLQVPRYGARNFREALQMFRILHFALWLEGNYHNTVGRFDVYMDPYYRRDREAGVYTEEQALDLLEDFFLSFNKDSDLYFGVQQGDNGQSMMLGGLDRDGREVFSELSALCLRASRELMLIDPKINLRVSANTPLEVYRLGSELTKAGLGFPQYSNDDVVIPGLERLGYDRRDATDYSVAACWEFIIPGVGADVANIGALSFPRAVDEAFHQDLLPSDSFADFLEAVRGRIRQQADALCASIRDLWFVPSPFLNIFYSTDISRGAKYNNFGIHGTGIATAADSLYAIQKYVYEEKRIGKQEYLEAVDSDFAVHGELLPLLRYETPKMGQNDERVDGLAVQLLAWFSEALEGKTNCRGGRYRAGTGSAMYYLWHADAIGASPDGRRKGEPFGANFSPSLFARIDGVYSVIRSFTKPDTVRAVNGGPLTLEFSASLFSSPDAVEKVARLVKAFIRLGGHQLQLNAVSLEKMRDAQQYPERYPHLVVRIWGWSAYFVELDKEYQDHVMARSEFGL